jgi:hypothetical protein
MEQMAVLAKRFQIARTIVGGIMIQMRRRQNNI